MKYIILNNMGEIQGIVDGYLTKEDIISELAELAYPYQVAKANYKYVSISDLRYYKKDADWLESKKNLQKLKDVSGKMVSYKGRTYRIDQIYDLSLCKILSLDEFIVKYTLNE